ncbi:MAG: DNA-directed RNA polymerase subunit delta [Acholeplasma sp.]|jgi:DNA-directed RNA polymerase subunit delta|nr:DNA-directed RNA polymerase subunit delta [Acholeplasma sp.]
MAKQTYVNKSMVEIAEDILRSEGKKNIYDLIEQVASLKEISLEDTERMTQLYIDMTLSAKFVFCGNDEWDLKENNLDLWDKDGSYFNTTEEVVEEEEDTLTVEDYYIPEEDELELKDDEDDEEAEDEDDDVIIIDEDELILTDDDETVKPTKVKFIDEDDDDLDFDDEDYNEIMDDYEDMYDK